MEIIHFSMKAKSIITIALMAVLGLSSCDSNKSTVEDLTNQFVTALQNNDVATIYDLYPDAKLVSNMKLPRVIQLADIDVEKDNATGNYTATIRNPREQKLEFKVLAMTSGRLLTPMDCSILMNSIQTLQ